MPEPRARQPLPVRDDLPAPTEAEVQHLADLLTDAELRGIRYGHWTLARVLLGAGYRLVLQVEVQYGECRACARAVEVNEHGGLVDHDDDRRGRPCIGARNTPLRLVDAPEVVSVDGR